MCLFTLSFCTDDWKWCLKKLYNLDTSCVKHVWSECKADVEMGWGQGLWFSIVCERVFTLQLLAICTFCSFRFVHVNRQVTFEWPALLSHFHATSTCRRTLVKLCDSLIHRFHCLHDLHTSPLCSCCCMVTVAKLVDLQAKWLKWGHLS